MLTIDWKERLVNDTKDYLANKLPNKDYDFDIIFNAYPERVSGKIPSEVINFVSGKIVTLLGRKHAKYIPFYLHLWDKKGEYGRSAFIVILSRLFRKQPEKYLEVLEHAMNNANPTELSSLLERVVLPVMRKDIPKYLPQVLTWNEHEDPEIRKASVNLIIKLIRRRPDAIPEIIDHFTALWLRPLGEDQANHIALFKAIRKIDPEAYSKVWSDFGHQRDPEIVEILTGTLQHWEPEIEEFVEIWTKSGNARVKKAGLSAMRTLQKKKKKKAKSK